MQPAVIAWIGLSLVMGRPSAQDPGEQSPLQRFAEVLAAMKAARDANAVTAVREHAARGWEAVKALPAATLVDPDCRSLLALFARYAVDAQASAIGRDAALLYLAGAADEASDDVEATRQSARMRVTLSIAWTDLGDYAAALVELDGALAGFLRILPPDDREVLRVRRNSAGLKARIGDLQGSLAEFESILAQQRATLPEDDLDVCLTVSSVAVTKLALGDHWGARELLEALLPRMLAQLPFEDRNAQACASNLCSARVGTGDLDGAAELGLRLLQVRQATLPDDHPNLNSVRNTLANIKLRLGDLEAARALVEKSLSASPAGLPESHQSLQNARHLLARIHSHIGDFAGARAVLEQATAIDTATLPVGHPQRTRGLGDLAMLLAKMGESKAALDLQRRVVAEAEQGSVHPRELLIDRWNLAALLSEMGDHAAVDQIYAATLDALPEGLREDDPAVMSARLHRVHDLVAQRRIDDAAAALAVFPQDYLASSSERPQLDVLDMQLWIARGQGDPRRAQQIAREIGTHVLAASDEWNFSPREIGARARRATVMLSRVLNVAVEGETAAVRDEFFRLALEISETLRGAEPRAARQRATARRADPRRAAELENALRRAVARIDRAVAARTDDAESTRELAAAVLEKERIERELGTIARGSRGAATSGVARGITAARLIAALPPRSVGLTIIAYDRNHLAPELLDRPIQWTTEMCAILVRRDGEVRLFELGPKAPIEALVARLRACATGTSRGDRPTGEDLDSVLGELGERLLRAPLAACPADTETLVLSLDELLQIVPIDALRLPRADDPAADADVFVGDRYVIEQVTSLADLVLADAPIEVGAIPTLVAFGGIDYDGVERDDVAVEAGLRGGAPERFAPLVDSRREVRRIAAMFQEQFDADETRGAVATRFGASADSESFVAAVAGATFVHLATHGYFAKESIRSVQDGDTGRLTQFEFGNADRVSGLSPSMLTGLAFAGANQPRDVYGRRAGIMTAEQLLTVDLSSCHLATLSACDTSLGVRRAGQGHASLRSALQGAGARFVLSSLWKVSDEAAMEWMTGFYDRLWRAGQAPHAAFWATKRAARAAGMPFRDWAGWVLSGR